MVLCERGIKGFDKRHAKPVRRGGGAASEGPVAPADHRRSQPCDRPARLDPGVCLCGCRGRAPTACISRSTIARRRRFPTGRRRYCRSNTPKSPRKFARWRRCLAARFHAFRRPLFNKPSILSLTTYHSPAELCDALSSPETGRCTWIAARPSRWRPASRDARPNSRTSISRSVRRLSIWTRSPRQSQVRRWRWALRTCTTSAGGVHRRSQPGDARQCRLQVCDPRPQRAAHDLSRIERRSQQEDARRLCRRADSDRLRRRTARRARGRPDAGCRPRAVRRLAGRPAVPSKWRRP